MPLGMHISSMPLRLRDFHSIFYLLVVNCREPDCPRDGWENCNINVFSLDLHLKKLLLKKGEVEM
jgi:hypothetical protein